MAMPGYSPLSAANAPSVDLTFPPTVEATLEEIGEVVIEVADIADNPDSGRSPAVTHLKSWPVVAGIPQRIEGGNFVANDKAVPSSPPQIRACLVLNVLKENGSPARAEIARGA
jgi:hypothetical protein